ncbi:M24 family metallopeptidase [Egicoccus sp. AB-alg6-2]|uniref:M24 family metallopeptidase n=1 Tax=Egicoccus sp. AB-alg6-2 TaxID=3242692 RepID=UPI00359DE6D0
MAECLFPQFSLAEREQRWSRVRSLMDQWQLAVIVTPANTGHSTDFQANSRYLSHCGGGVEAGIAVVFPADGEVTVAATEARARWGGGVQNWVSDLREANDDYGSVIIERLKELRVGRARIGITGLGPGTRTAEGAVLFATLHRIKREFPNATFVDATPILEECRLVKSAEEIEWLEQSTRLITAAYEAERAAAKVGALDYVVYAETRAAMLRGGSEAALHCNWVSGPSPARTLTRPSFRRLERGDIIINEIESSWGGYRAQGIQPIGVETCDPVYHELLGLQGRVFDQMLPMLKPGTTLGELVVECEKICQREQPTWGVTAGARAQLIMHGRGMGDDGPIVTNSAKEPRHLRLPLQEGMVFIFKPQIRLKTNTHPINWGDTVVVTSSGGRRLGDREQGMWIAS